MIGPIKKTKTIEYLSCEGCEVLTSVILGGTAKFPKKRTNWYCKHPDLTTGVAYIKLHPKTPAWCPVLIQRGHGGQFKKSGSSSFRDEL